MLNKLKIYDAIDLKTKIKTNLENSNFSEAEKLLFEYDKYFSFDAELYSLKGFLLFNQNKPEDALKILLEGKSKFEYNDDIILNLSIVQISLGNLFDGLSEILKLLALSKNDNVKNVCKDILNSNLPNLTEPELKRLEDYLKSNNVQQTKFPYINENCLTGKFIDNNPEKGYFCGIFDNYNCSRDGLFIEDMNKYIPDKIKIYQYLSEILKGKKYINSYCSELENDAILPVLSLKDSNAEFIINGNAYSKFLSRNRWYYFRLNKNDSIKIFNNTDFIVGDLIPIKYDPSKPKLILNIFVDGLSQKVLEEEGLDTLMPHTYKFFKEGAIFNNCYSSGEWTLVSMASFYSGLYTHNHMVYHNSNNSNSLDNKTLFTNHLKNSGYFNAKIDGDWRSTPSYGYIKDMDRYIYCAGVKHMQSNEIVMHAVEHIETFKEINQSLWVCFPDLHDIADEYEQYPSIQTAVNSKLRFIEPTSETSVQKKYSANNEDLYKHSVKRIDTYLSLLLNYVKENYSEDEFVVNLVSDHGQGYLVKPNNEFLDEHRIKVPLMIRGKNIPKITSNELIQGLDIYNILCNEAKILPSRTDSNLPKTLGGSTERNYVFSESLFVNSTYKACFIDSTHKIFFETKENVTDDGFVNLNDLSTKIINKHTNIDETDSLGEKIDYYKNELFNKLKFNWFIK